MTFEEWADKNNLSEYGKACSRAAWQAAQKETNTRLLAALKKLLLSWETRFNHHEELLVRLAELWEEAEQKEERDGQKRKNRELP